MDPALSLALTTRAALLLRLPTSTTATAAVFVHGWFGAVEAEVRRGGGSEADAGHLPPLPPPRLAAAALFLASKADTAAVGARTNDLVNAVACVAAEVEEEVRKRRAGTAAPSATPLPPPPPAWAALAGRAYASAKGALLADEAMLLRALRFQVAPQADAALRAVLNAGRLVGRGRGSVRGAAGLCADALSLTTLPRSAGPVTTAAAALVVAGLVSGEEGKGGEIGGGGGGGALSAAGGVSHQQQQQQQWWPEALGVRSDGVLAAADELVGMLERVAGRGLEADC